MVGVTLRILVALLFVPAVGLAKQDFISGRVLSDGDNPEAGVWVIAETNETPTIYRKIVVTGDDGKFVIPELPDNGYRLWVRGYGLKDSSKVEARPGDNVLLTVELAETPMEAAAIYPANYWLALMDLPTSDRVKNAALPYESNKTWSDQFKLNCIICHQQGSAYNRLPVRSSYDHGLKKVALMDMLGQQLNRDLLLDVLGEWGEKIGKGVVPESPPRPQGIERNFVITQWQYGERYTYAHDVISTDKRNPSLYPDGLIYGLDIGNDHLLTLDTNSHQWSQIKLPPWPNAVPWCDQTYKALDSDEVIPVGAKLLGCPSEGVTSQHPGAYNNPVNAHNPMFDDMGRVWMTMQIRREWGEDLPDFCQKDPFISSYYHHRQLGYYDTKTGNLVPVDTCFGTHHLQFDAKGVLWTNGDDRAIGWLDTAVFDADKPETLEQAMGWSEAVVDTDGDDVADTPIVGFRYSIIPNPAKRMSGYQYHRAPMASFLPMEKPVMSCATIPQQIDTRCIALLRLLLVPAVLMWTAKATSGPQWLAADISRDLIGTVVNKLGVLEINVQKVGPFGLHQAQTFEVLRPLAQLISTISFGLINSIRWDWAKMRLLSMARILIL